MEHARRIARAAVAPRRGRADAAPVQLLIVETGGHSWSYEDETYRRTVAAFLARALGGPLSPEAAADAAAAADARRLPEAEACARRRPGRRAGAGDGRSVVRPGTVTAWDADPDPPGDPPVRRRADCPTRPGPDPPGGPPGRQLEEQPALGLHRLSATGPPRGAGGRRSVGRAPRRGGGRDRPRHARSPPAATRPCRSCSTSARRPTNMMLAAWELGIGSVPATVYEQDLARRHARLPGRPATASTCCRSAIRPTRPSSRRRSEPAAAGRWPRWSTRSAGSSPEAAGNAARSSRSQRSLPLEAARGEARSRRPSSRRGPRRRPPAARTPRRRP